MVHQSCLFVSLETLFAVMLLRSSRFYLFEAPYYYEHLRLPRLNGFFFHNYVRVSHVHALPSSCTQHHLTPGICQCSFYRCSHWHGRFQHLWQLDRYHWCNEALLMQLTEPSRLSFTGFVSSPFLCQAFFNPNGKFGCKALSSFR